MAEANWVREYQDGEVVPGTAYRVVRLMGVGGMGSVYEVEQVESDDRYVFKQLLRTLASREDLVLRMEKEWKALGALRHPNIVDVVYAGKTADGTPYYVMELLVGETVRERLEREGKLSAGLSARVAHKHCSGLAAAHAVGVVHRDIKPANIFLTRDGAVKVLDFGISYSDGVRKIYAGGTRDRHAALHVTRTGIGRESGRALRPLCGGALAVRDARRRGTFRRSQRDHAADAGSPAHSAATTISLRGGSRGARSDRHARAVQESPRSRALGRIHGSGAWSVRGFASGPSSTDSTARAPTPVSSTEWQQQTQQVRSSRRLPPRPQRQRPRARC